MNPSSLVLSIKGYIRSHCNLFHIFSHNFYSCQFSYTALSCPFRKTPSPLLIGASFSLDCTCPYHLNHFSITLYLIGTTRITLPRFEVSRNRSVRPFRLSFDRNQSRNPPKTKYITSFGRLR